MIGTQEEWMVDCQSELRKKGEKESLGLFVSRGNSAENFFVYSSSHEKIHLLVLSSNVVKYYDTSHFPE